ncbi:MAG: molybdenum cofactor guanylyltransferase [Bacteroidales bacterium]|nr:molybdenum cofactor guanylyltransferase [Bacteroidales bacterium]
MHKDELLTGIILAGGLNKRFGSNKAVYLLQGRTLLKKAIDLLSDFCNEIIISGNDPEYEVYNLKMVEDVFPYSGPLGGVFSALNVSNNQKNLIVSCNMPFLNKEMVASLVDLEKNYDKKSITLDHTVFCFNYNSIVFPYPIILYKSINIDIKRCILNNKESITEFILNNNIISYTINDDLLKNMKEINTPDDLIRC